MPSYPRRTASTPEPKAGNRLRIAAFVIYGTLGLLLVTIPGSVVDWLQGFDGSAVQRTALQAAQAVQRVSDSAGFSAPYIRLRTFFLQRIRGE